MAKFKHQKGIAIFKKKKLEKQKLALFIKRSRNSYAETQI